MASNSKKNKPQVNADEITDANAAPESDAAETAEGDAGGEGDPAPEEDSAAETEAASVETPAVVDPTSSTNIHERLEVAELAAMIGSPDKAHALNRVTLLTGALKTALPEAISHADAPLKGDLQALLGML